jgi:DNA-binding MarR family transcriptional regulator
LTECKLINRVAFEIAEELYEMDNAEKARQWMTTTEATSFLGISSKTMTRLIREGVVETHNHPLDRRKKLVRYADITRLKEEAERAAA